MVPVEPTLAEVEQATVDYQRAAAVLKRHALAVDVATKQTFVGKCFRFHEPQVTDEGVWPVYLAAIHLDRETGALTGWHFQLVPNGRLEMGVEPDLQPGFLLAHCDEVPRDVFVTQFNDLLTAVADFATKMPT